MGNGASQSNNPYQFEGAGPDCEYDEIHACFNNGLLYRITGTDEEGTTWGFYNDTKNKEFHVKVLFHGSAEISALGNTTIELIRRGWKSNNSGRNPTNAYLATLVVYPGCTEAFIEGRPNGFQATYDMSKVTSKGKKYARVNGRRYSQSDSISGSTSMSASRPDDGETTEDNETQSQASEFQSQSEFEETTEGQSQSQSAFDDGQSQSTFGDSQSRTTAGTGAYDYSLVQKF